MFNCISISGMTNQACAPLSVGGVQSIAMVAFKDVDSAASVSVSGTLSGVVVDALTTWGKVDQVAETASFSEDVSINIQNGTASFAVTLNLVINNFNTDSRKFVDSVLGQPVLIMVKMRSGKYTLIGGNGFARISAVKNGSGLAAGDRNGYEITITSSENELLREYDAIEGAAIFA